jgi:hypothetical protein
MTGGAFAAKYLITSTSQIKPSVLKKLKGATGPAGAAGAQGAQGPAGAAGAAGKDGAQGPQGEKGPKGEQGAKGEKGAQGEKGEAGKDGVTGFTATLPPGATETGSFANVAQKKLSEPGEEEEVILQTGGSAAVLTFPIPLTASIPNSKVLKINSGDPIPTECDEGTVAEPKASPGYLCIYSSPFSGGSLGGVLNPGGGVGAGKTGAVVISSFEQGYLIGTYAVTGCGNAEFPCP